MSEIGEISELHTRQPDEEIWKSNKNHKKRLGFGQIEKRIIVRMRISNQISKEIKETEPVLETEEKRTNDEIAAFLKFWCRNEKPNGKQSIENRTRSKHVQRNHLLTPVTIVDLETLKKLTWISLTSTAFMMRFLAACSLPTTSSNRAEAIQAGGCLGFVSRTDFSNKRAFFTSLMSPNKRIKFHCFRQKIL